MILHFMWYSLAIGALAASCAWLVERALIGLRSARRFAYIGGICMALLAPALVLVFNEPEPAAVQAFHVQGSPQLTAGVSDAVAVLVSRSLTSNPGGGSANLIAGLAWAALSTSVIAFYLLSAWRLSRRTRRWSKSNIGSQPILVSPDIGPAVFGWWRPRVIFPRWLVTAPTEIRQLALAHEDQHLAARDPQVLATATLLSALFPWSPALSWMLRRLRFAMEVDCDARVLRAGIDAGEYGAALLYVSERQTPAPAAAMASAMALIERTSQLERRINIMFSSPRKTYAWIGGACLALAAGCIFAATKLDAPSRTSAATLKPPPAQGIDSAGFRLGQKFELLLRKQYPDLIRQKFEGTPVVVALVNEDWTIAKSARLADIPADRPVEPGEEMFSAIGLTPDKVPYLGAMTIQIAQGSDKQVLMVYTEKQVPGVRFVSRLFPDTRAADREIYRQTFPAGQKIPKGQSPWVLLDRSGKVLRSGVEKIVPKTWLGPFQQRYEVRTQEFTVTPIIDEKGKPLLDLGGKEVQLNSIWLAPGSPSPKN
jgi:beta-lactamase regulating signal transducer with metallopeptidase domain